MAQDPQSQPTRDQPAAGPHWRAFAAGIILCLAGLSTALAAPYAALVADVESERVFFQQDAHDLRHPASLTKMMTLYLVFDAITEGKLSLTDRFYASRYACSRPPSKLGLRVGESITVEQGIYALVTQSANDAATVIAEGLAGSEAAFANRMTRKARQLGMTDTVFRNPSGLPDPAQVTTAWDMFRLAKALLKRFPQFYPYFSTDSFEFRNRRFRNHNHLLERYDGADGIKTGYVNASGFNLVASARRNGQRLIGVVFGGRSAAQRDNHMAELLDDGFGQIEGQPPRTYLANLGWESPPSLLTIPRPAKQPAVEATPSDRVSHRGKSSRAKQSPKRGSWQIRLGEFPKEQAAEQKLSKALKAAPSALRGARVSIATHRTKGKKVYVAYFKGLNKEDASSACSTLKRKRMGCVLVSSR